MTDRQQSATTTDESNDDGVDARRLILPYVDTATALYKGRSIRELLPFVPGGMAFLAAGLALMFGAIEWTIACFVFGIPLWVGAKIVDLKTTRVWYLSPTALVGEWFSSRKFRKRLPWGHAAGLDNVHDVHRVRADGSVERSDGSYAALIAVEGRNTDRLTPAARERIVSR